MPSETNSATMLAAESVQSVHEQREEAYRVLFFSLSEPDIASGTPVIVCDMMAHFPPSDAELLCERRSHVSLRRKIDLPHRVRRVRFPNCLWPFRRGSRVREMLDYVKVPWLVLVGCWRVMRFRPTAIVSIYYGIPWIIASYLVARLTRTPLIFYVHDTVRENLRHADGLSNRFVVWLEEKSLLNSRVMVLHPYLADHYRERYGIESTILRQMIWRQPLPRRERVVDTPIKTIGFAGAIYDNNASQLADLGALVSADPRLRLKIWTSATPEQLAARKIGGQRVEIGFESNYERLLERLSECDLLYLPLAFDNSATMTTEALQYAFPTKCLDYLLAGPPILVHCPANFELSRFFTQRACAYVVNEGDPAALRNWLDRWLAREVPPIDSRATREAVKVFSPQENRRLLWQVLSDVSRGAPGHKPRTPIHVGAER